MRNIILVCILVNLGLSSCRDLNDDKNKIWTPQDTSLYITFNINGKSIKYYQAIMANSGTPINKIAINGDTIANIRFDHLFYNIDNPDILPAWLIFWDTISIKKDIYKIVQLSSRIRNKYKFTSPKINQFDLAPADTIFLIGTSFFLGYKNLSTKAVFEHFNFDNGIFSNPILKDSYLIIDKLIPVTDNLILVKGTFNTVLMNSPFGEIQPEVVPVSGSFKFTIK